MINWAIEHNGETKIFSNLPKSWGLSDNLNETSAFELGFKRVVTPTYDPSVEELTNFHFDSVNDYYTYDVVGKIFTETLAELKAQKIVRLKAIFKVEIGRTDWYVTRGSEPNYTIPQNILDERAALRTQSNDLEAQINALTTKKAVVSFVLPSIV